MNDPHQLSSNLTIRSICQFPTFYVVLLGSSFDHKGHWALAKLLAIGHTSHRHSPRALPSSSDRNPNLNPHLPLWEGVDARICSKRIQYVFWKSYFQVIYTLKFRGCNIYVPENIRRKCVQIALEMCASGLWDDLLTDRRLGGSNLEDLPNFEICWQLSGTISNDTLPPGLQRMFSLRSLSLGQILHYCFHTEKNMPIWPWKGTNTPYQKKQLEVAGLFKKSAITPVMGAAHMMI